MKSLKDPNNVRDVAYLTLSETFEYYQDDNDDDQEGNIIKYDTIKQFLDALNHPKILMECVQNFWDARCFEKWPGFKKYA